MLGAFPGGLRRAAHPYTGPVTPRVPPHEDGRPRYEGRTFTAGSGEVPDLAGALVTECVFRGCEMSEASLRGAHLTECTFEGCELAMVDLSDALLQWTTFTDCRLTGVRFGDVRRDAIGLSVTLEGCDLTLASFRDLDLRSCVLRDCTAREAEFQACDLRGMELTGTDFDTAVFHRVDLRDADLRGARNYVIDPCANRLAGMHVDLPEALGLLGALRVILEP